jgi:hypothetical protein
MKLDLLVDAVADDVEEDASLFSNSRAFSCSEMFTR